MEIEQGFYVKQHIENLNYDDYFLVLEVENKHIKATKHRGTPVDSVILDYNELTGAGYTIEVLSEKYVDFITKYDTYRYIYRFMLRTHNIPQTGKNS